MYLRMQRAPTLRSKTQHCSFPHLSLQLCLNIGPIMLLRPEAELSADIAPTADYWGWLVDTGPLLQCCSTDSSSLCLIVLPAAHSCISSHELLRWMGQAYGIHNNILLEEVFICTGSVSAWSLQEKAWYQFPNTDDETRDGDYTWQPKQHIIHVVLVFMSPFFPFISDSFTSHKSFVYVMLTHRLLLESSSLWTIVLWMYCIKAGWLIMSCTLDII